MTIDAMGCRKKKAREIVKKGADYVLAVKKNRPAPFEYGERTRFASIERDQFQDSEQGAWARRSGRTGARLRGVHATENMSTLSCLALNPAKDEKSLKIGVAAKRKKADRDSEYRSRILRVPE